MNFNQFYHNNSYEFKEIKKRIWHFNNAIPPLPKETHPISKCFKTSLLSYAENKCGGEAFLEKCKGCDSILNIYVENDITHYHKPTVLCITIEKYYTESAGPHEEETYWCNDCSKRNFRSNIIKMAEWMGCKIDMDRIDKDIKRRFS